jgi:hypothetical protein
MKDRMRKNGRAIIRAIIRDKTRRMNNNKRHKVKIGANELFNIQPY